MGCMTANFSSCMMENHIPASVLDATHGFSCLLGSDGSQFLFSLGDDQIFRVSADLNTGCSAWTTCDVASTLLETITGAQVKCFAVSYAPLNGTITIVLVLEQTQGGDLLYVASGLIATAQAQWLADGGAGIQWVNVVFDSTAFDTIVAASLNISEIALQLSIQAKAAETPLAYATVTDPSNGFNRVFFVEIPPAGLTPLE